MRILVIGSGGREHALAWKIAQSPKVDEIFCAPGNAGIRELAECVDIKAEDIVGLLNFAKLKKIDLTVVGPEQPLVNGIVDEFQKNKLKIFGPSKAAAQLEGSKVFAKEFMARYKIPTADFKIFTNSQSALEYLKQVKFPVVVKADGLAAGKGVMVVNSISEAQEAVELIMEKRSFGSSGDRIIIEDCLVGEEASMLAICDGKDFILLSSSQDHKRVFDQDSGPNTGGMGAYSPAPVVTEELSERIKKEVFQRVMSGLELEHAPFKGVLYAGIMVTKEGPKVLEFNVRFGDPETQVLLPRMEDDLAELMLASVEGKLDAMKLAWKDKSCVCVVMSSAGYPGRYEAGKKISGLSEAQKEQGVLVFHAATKPAEDGTGVVTSGGRVLNVVGISQNLSDAIQKTYRAVERIDFAGKHYRKDIGYRAISNIKNQISR